MCEYCGCRSLRSIEELTREHAAALEHIATARAPARDHDLTLARTACAELSALLAPHTTVEEEGLFPAMAREHPEHVARLHGEHVAVHAVLHEVTSEPLFSRPTRLDTAMHILREHLLKEQDGLFPAALTSLSSDDWEAIEAVRSRVGSVLHLAW